MFSHKKMLGIVAIAGCCVMRAAVAESAADQIVKINESIAVLSAKKAELQLQFDIASKQAEISKLSGTTGQINTDRGVMPVVRGIEGVDGKLYAMLSFGGGMQQTVKQGEKIHGDWTIAQIDVSSVTLTRGRERIRLAFGTEPPAVQASPGGQQLPVPPFPR